VLVLLPMVCRGCRACLASPSSANAAESKLPGAQSQDPRVKRKQLSSSKAATAAKPRAFTIQVRRRGSIVVAVASSHAPMSLAAAVGVVLVSAWILSLPSGVTVRIVVTSTLMLPRSRWTPWEATCSPPRRKTRCGLLAVQDEEAGRREGRQDGSPLGLPVVAALVRATDRVRAWVRPCEPFNRFVVDCFCVFFVLATFQPSNVGGKLAALVGSAKWLLLLWTP
jgi:hypothetical protein